MLLIGIELLFFWGVNKCTEYYILCVHTEFFYMECTYFVMSSNTRECFPVIGSMLKKNIYLLLYQPYVGCVDHCLEVNSVFYFYSLVKSFFMTCMMFFSFGTVQFYGSF